MRVKTPVRSLSYGFYSFSHLYLDFHRKDLEEAIESGVFPKWTFAVQIIEEKDEHSFDFDILDATKVWPSDLVPIQPIGEFELNKTVDEFFTEVEQVAFCTSHIVPGIGFSDDPLLQGRNFSYFDTQLSRLGVNWQEVFQVCFSYVTNIYLSCHPDTY